MPAPKGVDTAKYDRAVEHIKQSGSADNPYAVAAATLKKHQNGVRRMREKRRRHG